MKYTLKTLDQEKITSLCQEFGKRAERMNVGDLSRSLQYTLRELIHNALKANAKRIFAANNTHMNQAELVYAFAQQLQKDFDAVFAKLKEKNLEVTVDFIEKDDAVIVIVENNADMLPEEQLYVNKVLEQDTSARGCQEDYIAILEGKRREGGGLGLRSILKILDSPSLRRSSLSYDTGNSKTSFKLEIKAAS